MVAAAACRVAFFLPVVPELFYGFDVVSFGIEAVRVPDFCEKVVLVGCFRVLVVCFSGIDVLCEFECEHGCSAAAALECDFCLVDPESVHGSDGWHERKGSRFASVQVEATPRLDVDELYFASVRRGYHFLEDIKFPPKGSGPVPGLCLGSKSFHGGSLGVGDRLAEGGGCGIRAGGVG